MKNFNRIMLCGALIFISTKSMSAEFSGAMGLKWGTKSKEVLKTVKSKIEFVKKIKLDDSANGFNIRFKGDFLGITTDKIEMEFLDDKLIAFIARYPVEAGTYDKLVKIIKDKYGEPKPQPSKDVIPTAKVSNWIFNESTYLAVIDNSTVLDEKPSVEIIIADKSLIDAESKKQKDRVNSDL